MPNRLHRAALAVLPHSTCVMAFSRTSTTAHASQQNKGVPNIDLFVGSSALFEYHVALIRKLWIAVAIRSNEQGNHPIELLQSSHFAGDLRYTERSTRSESLTESLHPCRLPPMSKMSSRAVIPTCSHCDKATLALAIARIEGTLLFFWPGAIQARDCYGNQLGCASRHSFFAHPL